MQSYYCCISIYLQKVIEKIEIPTDSCNLIDISSIAVAASFEAFCYGILTYTVTLIANIFGEALGLYYYGSFTISFTTKVSKILNFS